MRSGVLRDRRGMTLVELLAALLIMGFVTSAALAFVQQQERAFSAGTSRMEVLQNYRFAMELVERELRTVGAGTTEGQPFLVYADSTTLAFNADFATNDTENSFAVYQNPTAPIEEVGGLTTARSIRLPGTSFSYPAVTYRDGVVNSPAETIVFFFAPDTATAEEEDFVLFRQVNDLPPAVVARNLTRAEERPFFEYQEVIEAAGSPPRSAWVPRTAAMRHEEAVHSGADDERIDRVRAVRVSFSSTNGESGYLRQSREVSRLVSVPDPRVARIRSCGDAPLSASSIAVDQVDGEPRITVSWSASPDDGGGEDDVVRYAIFRRRLTEAEWGEPYFSVPAGSLSYTDGSVFPDSTYLYAVAAQDCTPSMSRLVESGTVKVEIP